MLNSIVGTHLRLFLPNGWVFEPWFTGPDFIEYQLVGGPHTGRHAIQYPTFRQLAPGVEFLGWYEETGTVVTLTWFLESQTVKRFAAVPKWLHDGDMAVSAGKNWDLDFLGKMQEFAAAGPDMPRHIYSDRGYFEVLEPEKVAEHKSKGFGTERAEAKKVAAQYRGI
ncbi:phenolic acid decarboxylase [Nocardia sp. NBC_00416]|uniref:phenolic acid decarboxylase n=1 Tax=Nocardia sp. NBC_00416 TaxID=2975991 RepID=UPI002E1FBA28